MLREAIPLDPRARADLIETTESLQTAHQAAAVEGSSAVPNAEDDVDLHYICFVKSKVNDHLYQLDGSRKGPLDRGPLGPEDDVFSPKALEAIQEFIDRERGDNVNFGLVALAPSMD